MADYRKLCVELFGTDDEAELRKFDAIYLGAIGLSGAGAKNVAPGILEKNILLKLRFDFDQYINLRPVKLYPGVASPISRLWQSGPTKKASRRSILHPFRSMQVKQNICGQVEVINQMIIQIFVQLYQIFGKYVVQNLI